MSLRGSLLEMRDPTEELRICESVDAAPDEALEVPARPPGTMPDFAAVGADGLVAPMEVPICLPESVLALVALELTLSFFTGRASRLESDSEGVRAVMELPIRDVILRLIRPLEPALKPVLELDTEGVAAVTELPIREVKAELTLLLESRPPASELRFDSGLTRDGVLALLPGLETDGVPEPIELPIRDVMAESMRLLELRFSPELAVEEVLDPLLRLDAEGVLAVMELPMRDVVLRLIPLLPLATGELVKFDVEGVRAVIELPMPAVRPELMRPLELLEMDGDALRALTDDPVLGALEISDRLFDEAGARDVLGVLEREDIDSPGVTVLNELLRLDEIADLELAGDCIERELILLLRL